MIFTSKVNYLHEGLFCTELVFIVFMCSWFFLTWTRYDNIAGTISGKGVRLQMGGK